MIDTLYFSPLTTQAQNYEHRKHDRRLNASLGFALAAAAAERDLPLADFSHYISQWGPLTDDIPSTMEILAQAHLQGVSAAMRALGSSLESVSLETRILLGFCAMQQQSFATALDILETNIIEIIKKYGKYSMEYLIAGIELVKCHNFLTQENKGEALARQIWSDFFSSLDNQITIKSPYQIYLIITMADSLIGQTKYDEAEKFLLRTLEHSMASSTTIVSTSLRLLKMRRRQRQEHPKFDVWDLLERTVNHLQDIPDILKYECVEEAMCYISVLEQNDPTQVSRAKAVLDILCRCSFKNYCGSKASNRNLRDHMHALQQYRKRFELFSVSGPQLHYSRMIRDKFPAATISFIERIGIANWNRFNRVKELPLRANIIAETHHVHENPVSGPSNSTFRDSALGSSLQTALKTARSHVSFQSLATSFEAGFANLPPMPDEVPNQRPFECQICCKNITDVNNKAQWK